MGTRVLAAAARSFGLMLTANPLLAHGPRSHDTGIVLTAAEPARRLARARAARADVDAPRLHLGPDHRSAA